MKRIEKLRELITKVRWNEQLKGFDMVEAWGQLFQRKERWWI